MLNNSAQAGDTHNKMARELTKIANECGISTTCSASKLPYRDAGPQNQTRKRADMMRAQGLTVIIDEGTRTNCHGGCVQPNHHLKFSSSTLLIMDVTIDRVYNVHHNYKSGNLHRSYKSGNQVKQSTNVSLELPVSYRTQMCIDSGLLNPDTTGSLRALFMIYRLKHQIHF